MSERIDHLKPLNYLELECHQMQQISDACGGLCLGINKLRDGGKLEEPL
ncbi:hypothetical protein [Nostoc sp. LPT]|nr:hypothetical protein [Nostoc sp. LPT]